MSYWPNFVVNSTNPKHVVESYTSRDPDVIAYCDDSTDAPRVRDGLELIAIAEPELWYDDDSSPWTERSVALMSNLLASFLPKADCVSERYIREMELEGDSFDGIKGIEADGIEVQFYVDGCGRGCCPGHHTLHTIPFRAFFDLDNLLAEIAEAKEKAKQEKELQLKAEQKKQAREARVAQEKRDQAEFERLQAKYKKKGGVK